MQYTNVKFVQLGSKNFQGHGQHTTMVSKGENERGIVSRRCVRTKHKLGEIRDSLGKAEHSN